MLSGVLEYLVLGTFSEDLAPPYGHNIMSYHCASCSFFSVLNIHCHKLLSCLCNICLTYITHFTLVGLVTIQSGCDHELKHCWVTAVLFSHKGISRFE